MKYTPFNHVDTQLNPRHTPVLAKEIYQELVVKNTHIDIKSFSHLDCNFGDAGHVEYFLQHMLKNDSYQHPKIQGIDADKNALQRGLFFLHQNSVIEAYIKQHPDTLTLHLGNFEKMEEFVQGHFDSILFDLGLSTYQLGKSNRGFSFKHDEPLDMRFSTQVLKDDDATLTATDVVNLWSPDNIALILRTYADETHAWKIAKAIEAERSKGPINTSKQLADLIEKVVPRRSGIHPATKTFQAIRIAVNGELHALETALEQSLMLLKPGGRIAVISYHSLEDGITKTHLKKWEEEGKGYRLNKKIIIPTDKEIEENPRSRSAKLRFFEKNYIQKPHIKK